MSDVTKLLARIGAARDAISRKEEQTGLDFMIDGVLMNCAVTLKEQQEQIDRLIEENASNAEMAEGLKELLKEQEAVVHCGDCENFCFDNISPNAGRCMLTNMSHSKTWFCAHGKREEGR